MARGLGIAPIDQVNFWATQGLFPDRVFLFDVDPEVGLSRAAARQNGMKDRLEQEPSAFHTQVRQAYLHIARSNPDTYRVIDATRGVEEIAAQLWDELAPVFGV